MLSRVRRALAGGGFWPNDATSAAATLRRGAENAFGRWHTGPSGAPGASAEDASVRIFGDFADVRAQYDGPRLSRQDGVFTIGSCFAREIAHHLDEQGARVLSLTEEMSELAAFQAADGRGAASYFHRFTPQAIWQEVARAFDAIPGWDEEASLLFPMGRNLYDFDVTWIDGSDLSRAAVLERRRAATARSRRLKDASCVIITLGLIEAWRHRPSGLWCNKVHPRVLKGSDDFEFHLTSYEETLECLEKVHGLLRAHGRPDVQMVVTVSPVPLQVTFTGRDVVEANTESKAVLRAAAAAFERRHENVHYFPSYEMVTLSMVKRAWRPDRLHVRSQLVSQIVQRFMALYYRPVEGLAVAAE